MSRRSIRERHALKAWEQKKRQAPIERMVNSLLRELRDRLCYGAILPGDQDRYQHATSECVEGRWAHALGVLTAQDPPRPRGGLSQGKGKLIQFPGAS